MTQDDNNDTEIDIEPLDTNQTEQAAERTWSMFDEDEMEGYMGTSYEYDEVDLPRSDVLGPVMDRVIDHAEDLLDTPIDLDIVADTNGFVQIRASHTLDPEGGNPDTETVETVFYRNDNHTIRYRYSERFIGTDDYVSDDTTVIEELGEDESARD